MQKTVFFIIVLLFSASELLASEGYVERKTKSVQTGVNWSVCATAIPAGTGLILSGVDDAFGWVALGGIVLGPSIGHFYAHQWIRGLAGVGLRTAVTGGLYMVADNARQSEDYGGAALAALVWVGSIATLSIYDIATVSHSVNRYNQNIQKYGKSHFIPQLDIHKKKIGLSLVYNF